MKKPDHESMIWLIVIKQKNSWINHEAVSASRFARSIQHPPS